MTAQPSAFGARPPTSIRQVPSAGRQPQAQAQAQAPALLQQLQQREQQQSQPPPQQGAPRAQGSTAQGSTSRGSGGQGATPRDGSSGSPWPERPAGPTGSRPIFGIQPVLFVGICLLAIVTVVTVVLIFVGDFESQASRVVWTVIVFLAFTGLLALDLVLARRSSTPLVIGVAANIYLLAVLMISIWMRGAGGDDRDPWADEWLFGELFGVVLLTILVVRAAAAAAWGLLELGDRGRARMARIIGLVAAALVGLVGILLTLHFAIDAFGIEVDEWYWRATVAAVVVTALASSVTVLLFWNRRNIDWQEAEARGEHVTRPGSAPLRPGGIGAPAHPGAFGAGQPSAAAAGAGAAATPQDGPVPGPSGQWPTAQAAGWPARPQPPAQTQRPAQPQAPAQHQSPIAAPPQPDAAGLLPWPTYPDGSPYPMGADGQPVFPPYQPR